MKTIKNKYFLIGLITPLILAGALVYGAWYGMKYLETRDKQVFNDGYEVGRFEQLNIDAEEQAQACFNISVNQNVNYLLKKYFKDCKTVRTIWAVAQAESSGRQFAVNVNHNFSKDGGFLQVNSIHRNKGESIDQFITRMHDLEQNIALAKMVYDKQGFNAWTQYKNGAYLKYLK